jgi:Na+-transporting NADH:ubiquinone oxidoreductase subunit A
MKVVTIKKGYRFRMAGAPADDVVSIDTPAQIALCADKVPFIKPRLMVKQGDTVRIGSLLMEDKRQPAIKFLSPAAGTVNRIQFGPRRVIEAVVIDCSSDEAHVELPAIRLSQLETMARDSLLESILQGGLWWVFRELPYRNLPSPSTVPPLIMVSLDAKEPFQPSPAVYLDGHMELFRYGVKVLETLSRGQVVISADHRSKEVLRNCRPFITHTVSGQYPCDDPATVLYRIKQSPDQNRAWTIAGQDLLLLARMLSLGRYPVERIIAVGGSEAAKRLHYRTRIGVPLTHLVDAFDPDSRIVVGGLMRGHTAGPDDFMDLAATAVTLIPKGDEARFLALFNPGPTMPSYSRTFLSRLNSGRLVYDCNRNGENRACIACMHCADVCPVDILPQMAYKAIQAEEIEEALQHGLLDCVECGLCAYVCPSKIELSQTFKTAKAAYAKEIGRDSAASGS